MELFLPGKPEFDPGFVGLSSEILRSRLIGYTSRIQVYYIKMGSSPKFHCLVKVSYDSPQNITYKLKGKKSRRRKELHMRRRKRVNFTH